MLVKRNRQFVIYNITIKDTYIIKSSIEKHEGSHVSVSRLTSFNDFRVLCTCSQRMNIKYKDIPFPQSLL